MKHIDETRLEDDLGYRFEYVTEFMGLGEDDIAAVHESAEYLAPVVPDLVNAVYDKLQSYDATWRHFVPRQYGYEGELPTSVEELTQDHPQIKFRKEHLGRYLVRLVSSPYDANMVNYLDFVGKMHTPAAGSPKLDVPLVQMNALMGFVADAVIATIFTLDIACEKKQRMIRAFGKLLWVQNDLINRHYAVQTDTESAEAA
ncbi:MAG: protoglobin family protein [Pirellulales bacterium]|nr:protoglobin family protein [Pirellulales bacterium]